MSLATILIIEDQASVRGLLVQVLKDAGYQVWEADNGRLGLEQFRAHPVDLVLTDLEMPEMNGLEVIVALTRSYVGVKIMAMSGANPAELQKATRCGARQIFPKPLDLTALLQAIHAELRPQTLNEHALTGTSSAVHLRLPLGASALPR
jgi:two-component system response regulator (stage 0 sporulation protein F)